MRKTIYYLLSALLFGCLFGSCKGKSGQEMAQPTETATVVVADTPFTKALANVPNFPTLQALLASESYQSVRLPYEQTPSGLIQPGVNEGEENEAHVYGKCLANGFLFVMGQTITLTGTDVFTLVALRPDGQTADELLLSAGWRTGGQIGYAKYEADANGRITITEFQGELDSDVEKETDRKTWKFDPKEGRFVETP